jgi:hypothetical protein
MLRLKSRACHFTGNSANMSAWHGFMSSSSFHEKAGECQVFLCFFLFFVVSFFKLFPLSQAASVATLPSALFVERLSLGARWVYLIQ